MFYCRKAELNDLNARYNRGSFECAVIYGRRRVGKTALITEFCSDKPAVFFSALNAAKGENLEALSRAIYEFGGGSAEKAPIFTDLDSALEEITRLSESKRLVFVIDEYPYLAKADPSVSSRLQHIIDRRWQSGKLFLILCGSSMSFMENQVLGYQSPLYGRRTAQYKITALSYKDTAEFNPSLSAEQQALVYGITGGVPHYINKLGVNSDISSALLENLFNPAGYLFEEPENLLKQELREPSVYNSVISAIAGGCSRLNEISTKTGIETAVCSKYIKVLSELGILTKETPITEKSGKKTVYRIGDNFFRFWYKFVPKNLSAVVTGRIRQSFDRAVLPFLPEYMGLIFEDMCKDYLLRYAAELPIDICNIGQWWGTDSHTKKQVQIDIVATPIQGDAYIIGSCKYKNEPVGADEAERLKEYATAFGKGKEYFYYIFSKSGFTEGLIKQAKKENLTLVTLEDLYK